MSNRISKKILYCVAFATVGVALSFVGYAQVALSPIEQLGEFLYFDENLSEPAGQSCASCHHPAYGFVDPDSDLPVSEGVIPGLFGGRNSPSAAYAMYAPVFHFDDIEGLWIGGQFWDGRATGEHLGDPLADQALGPFLNPVEMANDERDQVIADLAASDYAVLFEAVWGADSLGNVETAYDQVALSIAAFERSELFGQFTSKYDYYLQACMEAGADPTDCAIGFGQAAQRVGKRFFSKEEWVGFQLFMGFNNNDGVLEKNEGAMCVACHIADWTPAAGNVVVPSWAPEGWVPPLFTDFTFDNLGVPKNTEYPLEPNPTDLGLGGFVNDPAENGKFKVMTLRNIALTEPYGHNGLFKRLRDIVRFYNTRDVPGALPRGQDWPPPEVPETVNSDELGNLGLRDADVQALVEFMKTLSDGHRPD